MDGHLLRAPNNILNLAKCHVVTFIQKSQYFLLFDPEIRLLQNHFEMGNYRLKCQTGFLSLIEMKVGNSYWLFS